MQAQCLATPLSLVSHRLCQTEQRELAATGGKENFGKSILPGFITLSISSKKSRHNISPSPHPAQSSLRNMSPADLMLLTFVWDETASGTARSKTENGLHS